MAHPNDVRAARHRADRCVQLAGTARRAEPAPEAIPSGPADLPEILGPVARTLPGPFLTRIPELGTGPGFRRRGRQVAMAGQRLRLPGRTEISAVCTAHRGRGPATRLVRAVAAGIGGRGVTPFPHAAGSTARGPAPRVDRPHPAPPLPRRASARPGNNRPRPGVERRDEIRRADADRARLTGRREVTAVMPVRPRQRPLCDPHPYRSVRLHSRPHIDLQRVSAALCRR